MQKIKSDFIEFRNICILIRRDYNTYNNLFFSGNDEVLEKVAVCFFNDMAEILQRDWLLQVCKIMDRATSTVKGQQRENISIKLINEQLKKQNLFSKEIEILSKQLLGYGNLLKGARNAILAHNDRVAYINKDLLGKTSEKELREFLGNMQKYCDVVGNSIGIGPLDFTCSSGNGDVLDLIKVLKINTNIT